MTQPDLFDVGTRIRVFRPGETCTAAPIGTGPEGETCHSCLHYVRLQYSGTYRKCGLMRQHWTRGKTTDIRAGWAACRGWKERP